MRSTGKRGEAPQLDSSLFGLKLAAKATVYPDLNNKELQDSYGVMTPEDLLLELIPIAGELASYQEKVLQVSGFLENTFEDMVAEAKNE